MRIVETDNYNGDYPDEEFLNLPRLSGFSCERIAREINAATGHNHTRYWKVVENDYKLQPGFEP